VEAQPAATVGSGALFPPANFRGQLLQDGSNDGRAKLGVQQAGIPVNGGPQGAPEVLGAVQTKVAADSVYCVDKILL
jgi:hypothetical protein